MIYCTFHPKKRFQMSQESPKNKPKRPRLNLPYDGRKEDAGLWAYNHRNAILVTVACYIIFGVAFVAANIVIDSEPAQTEIVMDFTDLEALQEELRRAQELNNLLNEQNNSNSSSIANKISNQMGLDNTLEDHRTNAQSIYNEADRVQQNLKNSAEAYNLGLAQERDILNQKYEGEKRETYRVEGNVTVSYSLSNPVRHAVALPVPAYMCEVAGEVVVDITVNRDGGIVECSVNKSRSSKNECLRKAALEKAGLSLFDANPSAPARQRGTITYQFVAQ